MKKCFKYALKFGLLFLGIFVIGYLIHTFMIV